MELRSSLPSDVTILWQLTRTPTLSTILFVRLQRLHLRRPTVFLLLSAAAFLFVPSFLPAQTADDVINAYLKARGGIAEIKGVQTERVTATITLQPGTDGVLVNERKRPLKMHMEIIAAGQAFSASITASPPAGLIPLRPQPCCPGYERNGSSWCCGRKRSGWSFRGLQSQGQSD